MPRPRKKRRRREVTRLPRSDAALPEYDRSAVPEGLVTRRQLQDMGLSPGGNQGPVAILRCKLCATRPQWSCTHPTRGFLLRVDLATPKRVPTLAQERALDQAMAARQTCGECGRRFYICLSKKLGCCLECHDGTPVDPSTLMAPPVSAAHRLAASNPVPATPAGTGPHNRAAAAPAKAGRPLPNPLRDRRSPA